jgi:excisionase family DNA binding protein
MSAATQRIVDAIAPAPAENSVALVDPLSLLDKHALAQRLGMSDDGILKLVARRQIPVIRLGHRTVRFSWPAVEKALGKLTVPEATR